MKAWRFNTTFNRQVIEVSNLYRLRLKMLKLTANDIQSVIGPMLAYCLTRASGIIADSVTETILIRQKQPHP